MVNTLTRTNECMQLYGCDDDGNVGNGNGLSGNAIYPSTSSIVHQTQILVAYSHQTSERWIGPVRNV